MGTPGLIGDFVEQSGKLNLRVGKDLIELVNRTAGDAGSVQHFDPFGGRPFDEDFIENGIEVAPVLNAGKTSGKPRIYGQVRPANGFSQAREHSVVACGEIEISVASTIDTHRRGQRMMVAYRRRSLTRISKLRRLE